LDSIQQNFNFDHFLFLASVSDAQTSDLDKIVEDSVPVIIRTKEKAPETDVICETPKPTRRQSATTSKVQPSPITKRRDSTKSLEGESLKPISISLLKSSDLESIMEVVQPTPEPAKIEIEPDIPASPEKTENDTIALSVETPKAIRQSARRRSATPSKVLPSPITTRRDSRQTIGKSMKFSRHS
jgi:hypothetical protein